jgi:Saxitoxin biosynthesis operon protein SxtJ
MVRDGETGKRQLRSFGLIVGGGFAVVALAPLVLRRENPRLWVLVLALLLSATAFIFPSALGPFHRVWMTIGEGLGWLNNRILLTLLYYLIIVPIGVILRAIGSDPMRRKLDRGAQTYRIPRTKRPPAHLRRQY